VSEHQRLALDELLRTSPLDIGGDVAQQRTIFDQMLTASPPASDVQTAPNMLGAVPVVDVVVDPTATDVILFLHGGAFAIGSATAGVPLAADVARRSKARAISVEYRLAPEHPFPAALEDAIDAYSTLTTAVDPKHVAVVGESAGGGLTIAALVAIRDRGLPLPSSAAVFSPWVDLTLSGQSVDTKSDVDPVLSAAGLRRRADDYTDRTTAGAASPLFADLRGLPPLLIQVGSHEILLDDAMRLAARAAHDDVAVELHVTPKVPHVFQGFAAMLEEGDRALDVAGSFISRHFGAASSVPQLKGI
jgi:monoterpene epsilon-lactone hydrolase